MNTIVRNQAHPVVRTEFDFKLDQVPRFWMNNDPFLTRVFDALSLTFPDGERYFIQSVRLFRDKITDPELEQRVGAFIRQEAQHGIAHEKMNQGDHSLIHLASPEDCELIVLGIHFGYKVK
jgi:predicted metal-dependent hydrolase